MLGVLLDGRVHNDNSSPGVGHVGISHVAGATLAWSGFAPSLNGRGHLLCGSSHLPGVPRSTMVGSVEAMLPASKGVLGYLNAVVVHSTMLLASSLCPIINIPIPSTEPISDFGSLTVLFGLIHGFSHTARTIVQGHWQELVELPMDRSGLAAFFFLTPVAFPMIFASLKNSVSYTDTGRSRIVSWGRREETLLAFSTRA